ncbi:MAG: addiction module protein [Chloroflexi bacterium]|nr:addiction module protein [Chloroflexota bacterium]
MPRKLSDIQRDVMDLSRQERAALVEHLLATLDPGEEVEVEDLWLEEAEHRYAEYRAGNIVSRPADLVITEAKNKLK